MNRLILRRLVVNIFWTLVYGLVIGYICFYNVFNEKQIVNNLEDKVVKTIILNENYTKAAQILFCLWYSKQLIQKMIMKVLLCVALLATMSTCVLSSFEKYFIPHESEYREEGEHIDILIRKRNLRVEKVNCKMHRNELG